MNDRVSPPFNEPRPLMIAFVGYRGHQGSEYLNSVGLLRSVRVVGLVDAVADVDESDEDSQTEVFLSVAAMLLVVTPDVAIVTVPHDRHYALISELVAHGVSVLVEKPLVPDTRSAKSLLDLSISSGKSILTLTQRPLRPEFRYLREILPRLGRIYWAEWTYCMALPSPTSGWRSEWNCARGGVLLDMGYHVIDILVAMFGVPRVAAASKRFRYVESRDENLEDLLSASLDFPDVELGCHLLIARHAREKKETLELHGTGGVITVDVRKPCVTLFGTDGVVLDQYVGGKEVADVPAVVLGHYIDLANDRTRSLDHLRHHLRLVSTCEAIYAVADAS